MSKKSLEDTITKDKQKGMNKNIERKTEVNQTKSGVTNKRKNNRSKRYENKKK